MSKKPVMLCIMDGFGWTPDQTYGTAVVLLVLVLAINCLSGFIAGKLAKK